MSLIWEYRVPAVWGSVPAYGVPVTVWIPGRGRQQVVYRFQDGDQPAQVDVFRTGFRLAVIRPHHTGYPQQRAQQAVDEADLRLLCRALDEETLNIVPKVVGVLALPVTAG